MSDVIIFFSSYIYIYNKTVESAHFTLHGVYVWVAFPGTVAVSNSFALKYVIVRFINISLKKYEDNLDQLKINYT